MLPSCSRRKAANHGFIKIQTLAHKRQERTGQERQGWAATSSAPGGINSATRSPNQIMPSIQRTSGLRRCKQLADMACCPHGAEDDKAVLEKKVATIFEHVRALLFIHLPLKSTSLLFVSGSRPFTLRLFYERKLSFGAGIARHIKAGTSP